MKRIILLLISIFSFFTVHTQSLEDAVRYSLLNYQSTARSVGAGSSLGPMGVDFGAFGTNPSGLARLRFSEAAISLGANYSAVNAQYQAGNNSNTQSNIKPVLNNLGLAFANPGRRGKWKSRNFALSINRVADFNREVNLVDQTPGSITDRFLSRANGSFPQDLDFFEERLAFDVIAIDTIPGSPTSYFSNLEFVPNVNKDIVHTTTGSLNELQLTFAGNYNDKLLVGASLGLSFLDYTSERVHKENDTDNSIVDFLDLTFTDRLETVGAGANIKLGVTYMPKRTLFISISGQTPTWYLLNDTYQTSMEYAFDDVDIFFDEVDPNTFEFRFASPWRANVGVGVIIGNKGFISGEVEYLDYTSSKFDLARTDGSSLNTSGTDIANADIDAFLQSGINIRLGGEYTLDAIRVRAGFGTSVSPFNGSDEGSTSLSLGLGYRVKKLFVDLGLRATFRNELYFPYFVENRANAPSYYQPIIDNKNTDLSAVVTIGTKF